MFKLVSYSLKSEWRKGLTREAKNECVSQRIRHLSLLNKFGVKLGTSLFAINEKNLNIINKLNGTYIVGVADNNIVKNALHIQIEKLKSLVNFELNSNLNDRKLKRLIEELRTKEMDLAELENRKPDLSLIIELEERRMERKKDD